MNQLQNLENHNWVNWLVICYNKILHRGRGFSFSSSVSLFRCDQDLIVVRILYPIELQRRNLQTLCLFPAVKWCLESVLFYLCTCLTPLDISTVLKRITHLSIKSATIPGGCRSVVWCWPLTSWRMLANFQEPPTSFFPSLSKFKAKHIIPSIWDELELNEKIVAKTIIAFTNFSPYPSL